MTTARWYPITRYIVLYPDLLAVGGVTHNSYDIARQGYTRFKRKCDYSQTVLYYFQYGKMSQGLNHKVAEPRLRILR